MDIISDVPVRDCMHRKCMLTLYGKGETNMDLN